MSRRPFGWPCVLLTFSLLACGDQDDGLDDDIVACLIEDPQYGGPKCVEFDVSTSPENIGDELRESCHGKLVTTCPRTRELVGICRDEVGAIFHYAEVEQVEAERKELRASCRQFETGE